MTNDFVKFESNLNVINNLKLLYIDKSSLMLHKSIETLKSRYEIYLWEWSDIGIV